MIRIIAAMLLALTVSAASARSQVTLQACGIVGDSIASSISNFYSLTQCQKNVVSGTTASQIISLAKTIKPSRNIVISAGNNDQGTQPAALDRDLTAIRRNFRTSLNVIWVLPIALVPRAEVAKIAAKNGDKVVPFVVGPDGVHPLDDAKLAADVQAAMI